MRAAVRCPLPRGRSAPSRRCRGRRRTASLAIPWSWHLMAQALRMSPSVGVSRNARSLRAEVGEACRGRDVSGNIPAQRCRDSLCYRDPGSLRVPVPAAVSGRYSLVQSTQGVLNRHPPGGYPAASSRMISANGTSGELQGAGRLGKPGFAHTSAYSPALRRNRWRNRCQRLCSWSLGYLPRSTESGLTP